VTYTTFSIQQIEELYYEKEKVYYRTRAINERLMQLSEKNFTPKVEKETIELLQELKRETENIHSFWQRIKSNFGLIYCYKIDLLFTLLKRNPLEKEFDILRDD